MFNEDGECMFNLECGLINYSNGDRYSGNLIATYNHGLVPDGSGFLHRQGTPYIDSMSEFYIHGHCVLQQGAEEIDCGNSNCRYGLGVRNVYFDDVHQLESLICNRCQNDAEWFPS